MERFHFATTRREMYKMWKKREERNNDEVATSRTGLTAEQLASIGSLLSQT